MLVSFIIATKNRPERLRKALSFLKGQSYQHWEAVVCDDGDGRGYFLAQEDSDTRIIGVKNAGIAQVDARNTAITVAKGELLALHDDDDWWEDSNHLSTVVDAFSQSASSQSASSQSASKDAIKEALLCSYGWMVTEENGQEVDKELFAFDATPSSLLKNNTILTSSMVYPRQLHQKLGLFDRAVEGYFDWDWSLRVTQAGYPLFVNKSPSICYLVHGANGSHSVESERRLRNFQAFKNKHNLDILIKNHASLLQDD